MLIKVYFLQSFIRICTDRNIVQQKCIKDFSQNIRNRISSSNRPIVSVFLKYIKQKTIFCFKFL